MMGIPPKIWVACALFLLAGQARAADCPVEGVEAIAAAITQAPSCEASMKVFGSCGFGSTIDVMHGGIVIEKCEAEFLPMLAASRRRAYEREQNRCERKYARETGSEYRSLTAFCLAELAQKYARAAKGGKTSPARK